MGKTNNQQGRRAVVCLDGWAGRSEKACLVVGETRTRWRIQACEDMALPRRGLATGEQALVPKHAIRFLDGQEAAPVVAEGQARGTSIPNQISQPMDLAWPALWQALGANPCNLETVRQRLDAVLLTEDEPPSMATVWQTVAAAIWSVPDPDAGSMVLQAMGEHGYVVPQELHSSLFGQLLDSGRWQRIPASIDMGLVLPEVVTLDQAKTLAKALGRGQWCHPDLLPTPLFSTGRGAGALVDGWFEPQSKGLAEAHLDRLCSLTFSDEARGIIGGRVTDAFSGRNNFERRIGLFTPGVMGRLLRANILDGDTIAQALEARPAEQSAWRAACADGLRWQLEQATPQAMGSKPTHRL